MFDIKWVQQDDVLVGALLGRIDSSNAVDFLARIEERVDTGDNRLVLDFERVRYISSAGLRVCLMIARRFAAPGKRFAVCGLSQFNQDIVTTSGFDKIISLHESRPDALEAFQDP